MTDTLTKEQIEGMIAECKDGQDPFASGEVDAIAILALATKALDQADALPPDIAAIAARTAARKTGPWWTDAKYSGQERGCAVIAARTDSGPLPGNPTRGMVCFVTALLNTEARLCEDTAKFIAHASEDMPALLAEIARLTAALAEAEKRGYDAAKEQAAKLAAVHGLKETHMGDVFNSDSLEIAAKIRAMVKP